jgi:hypothetical protein
LAEHSLRADPAQPRHRDRRRGVLDNELANSPASPTAPSPSPSRFRRPVVELDHHVVTSPPPKSSRSPPQQAQLERQVSDLATGTIAIASALLQS